MNNDNKPKVLVVDDEADIRELLEITLGRMGLATVAAADLTQAGARLAEQRFDLCLTDMRLPDGDGIELVRHIAAEHPDTPVAVITAFGNTEAAVDSLKAGAFDFVSKPVDLQLLRRLTDQALKLRAEEPARSISPPTAGPDLIGDTPVMTALRATVAKLARSQAPVTLHGESGTGKELVARSIHALGPRADHAFVPVNCGAIPAELIESEFFGHEKGAFTGATRDKNGLFVAADGGTLFLDEVAECPLAMQVKLLRAIQERSVRPVGAEHERAVDVRILCASHKNLAAEVAAGRFREDLYYRLNVIEVAVPALRERSADIPLLAAAIVEKLAANLALDALPQLTEEAVATLQAHPFPGNVRELENVLERAVTLTEGKVIDPDTLVLKAAPSAQAAPPATPPADGSLGGQIENLERRSILDALEATRYNKTRAAKKLGITFRALRYRLKKLGIES